MTASSAQRPGLRSRSSKDWDRSADLVSTFSLSCTAEIRTARPKRHKRSAGSCGQSLPTKPPGSIAKGKERPIALNDIVIITPYKAQVFEIQQCLPGARVGRWTIPGAGSADRDLFDGDFEPCGCAGRDGVPLQPQGRLNAPSFAPAAA
jgi:hypothetical protein